MAYNLQQKASIYDHKGILHEGLTDSKSHRPVTQVIEANKIWEF